MSDEIEYWYITRPPMEPSKSVWHRNRDHAEWHIRMQHPDHELVICAAPKETIYRQEFVKAELSK